MPAPDWKKRIELAERYAPLLIAFPEKQELGRPNVTDRESNERPHGDYHPRTIELLLCEGRLFSGTVRSLVGWRFDQLFGQDLRPPASLERLARSQNSFDQIRLLGPAVPNAADAWTKYFEILNGRADQFPITTYAHVLTRAEALEASQSDRQATLSGQPFYTATTASLDDVVVQYWFCYYFDDWANIHEGDWEGISIFLRPTGNDWSPIGATYYQHENGARRHWEDMELIDGDHPLVYVASGSHASYFQYTPEGHDTQLSGYIIAQLKLKVSLKVNTGYRDFVPQRGANDTLLSPCVKVLPHPIGPRDQTDPAWQHMRWLNFPGSWGARELGRLIAGGPTGPSYKCLKWWNPFAWSEAECWPDYLIY